MATTFLHACFVLARALVRSRKIRVSALTLSTPSRNSLSDSRVLRQLTTGLVQKSYRGKQVHHLMYKSKAKDVESFSHLPQGFRNALKEAGWKVGRSPVHKAIKILLKLEDNRLIETVGMPNCMCIFTGKLPVEVFILCHW